MRRRKGSRNFKLVEGDVLDENKLAAADGRAPTSCFISRPTPTCGSGRAPAPDLEQNTIATYNVLEAMRASGVKHVAFSSTGSIYGEPNVFPTPEDAPFPVQTSLYGASKLAGEGLIQAYATGFGFRGFIFRFVSILGERYSHGHVYDFYKQLTPTRRTSTCSATASSEKAISTSRTASTRSCR